MTRDEAIVVLREALAVPYFVAPLPMNEVVELRMPRQLWERAVDAVDVLAETS